MNTLIHTRTRDLFKNMKAALEGQQHRVDGAFSLNDGKQLMVNGFYGKVFVDIDVPEHERWELMAMADELGISLIAILDTDTAVWTSFGMAKLPTTRTSPRWMLRRRLMHERVSLAWVGGRKSRRVSIRQSLVNAFANPLCLS